MKITPKKKEKNTRKVEKDQIGECVGSLNKGCGYHSVRDIMEDSCAGVAFSEVG